MLILPSFKKSAKTLNMNIAGGSQLINYGYFVLDGQKFKVEEITNSDFVDANLRYMDDDYDNTLIEYRRMQGEKWNFLDDYDDDCYQNEIHKKASEYFLDHLRGVIEIKSFVFVGNRIVKPYPY